MVAVWKEECAPARNLAEALAFSVSSYPLYWVGVFLDG
jgi:hypothetical protein